MKLAKLSQKMQVDTLRTLMAVTQPTDLMQMLVTYLVPKLQTHVLADVRIKSVSQAKHVVELGQFVQ